MRQVTTRKLTKGQHAEIAFRCRDIGYGIEEGLLLGTWTGEMDTWGKHTIEQSNGQPPVYLFADEILDVQPAPKPPAGLMKLEEFIAALRELWPTVYQRGLIQHIHKNNWIDRSGRSVHIRVMIQATRQEGVDANTRQSEG